MKTIAFLDIDDVLADLHQELRKRRISMGYDPTTCPNETFGNECWPDEERQHARDCFADPEFSRCLVPMPSAFYTCWWLHTQGVELMYMTGRSPELETVTRWWLSEWGFPNGALHMVPGAQKGELAINILRLHDAIGFAVEDSPHAIASYHANGIRTYIVAMPYNTVFQLAKLITPVAYVKQTTRVIYNLSELRQQLLLDGYIVAEED